MREPIYVRHYKLSLSDSSGTAILSDFGDDVRYNVSFTVQNIDTAAIVYIGAEGVTSSSYGVRLDPGAVVNFDEMPRYPGLYAISDTADSEIAILRMSK